MSHSTSSQAHHGLKVLSFNVWGVFAAKHIRERMLALGPRLAEFDIICLQEQFAEADLQHVLAQLPPHAFTARRFPSSFVGSGLTIISRFEITSAHFELYPQQGRPEAILEGDYMAAKGAALVRVRVGAPAVAAETNRSSSSSPSWQHQRQPLEVAPEDPSKVVDVLVYNTHLIAQYERYSRIGGYERETNAAARLSQALSLAQFIVHTARPRDFIVVCGDFNAGPDSPEMRLLLTFCYAHGIHLHRTVVHDGRTNATFADENAFNGPGSYLKLMSMEEDRPVQLDHILVSTRTMLLAPFGPSSCVAPTHHAEATAAAVGVVAFSSNGAVPVSAKRSVPLSDHYAVAARVVPFHPTRPPFFIARGDVDPRLLDDVAQRPREIVDFAANFLRRAALQARRQAMRWRVVAAACVLLPLLSWLCEGAAVLEPLARFAATDVPRFVWPTWPHHPLAVAVLGLWGGISLVIGLIDRPNNAVLYSAQADVLSRLLE